jgi:cobalt-zinc-cadmium resistance protein CzcA
MFAKVLTFSLTHRWVVLLGVLVLIAAGGWVVYTSHGSRTARHLSH